MHIETSTVGHMKGKKHLAYIRTLPCVVGRAPDNARVHPCLGDVEAHHPIGGGMGLKTDDFRAFPLCQKHHWQFHSLLGYFKGWDKAQIKEWERWMVP